MVDVGVPEIIQLGGCSGFELLAKLECAGVSLNQAAEKLLEDRRFSSIGRRQVVRIQVCSVGALGLAEGATFPQCVARARELGFSECPLELAVYLRLQWLDQPEAVEREPGAAPGAPPGSVTVASAPLDDSDETPRGFYLRNIGGVLWLRGYWSDAGHVWSPDDLFVFRRAD